MSEQRSTSSRQNIAIAVLAVLLVVFAGVLIGLVAGGGSEPEPTLVVAPTSTTTIPPSTTTAPRPTTTTTAAEDPPPVEELVFEAVEDTVIDSDDPQQILGTSQVLEVEREGEDSRWALVRFEVSGLPEGRPVLSATLRLFQLGPSDDPGLVSLVAGPWSENETSWATAPPLGDPVAPLPGGAEGVLVEVDVSPVVTGDGVYDFYLTTTSEDGLDYASRESTFGGPALVLVLGEPGAVGEAPPTATVLVGAGDIGTCASQGDEITAALIEEIVAGAREAVVFTVGDHAYPNGSAQVFARCYDDSWGAFKDITRPTPGAREYFTPGAVGYFEYFGENAGEPGRGYYSYDLGGWHIIVLNSNCSEVGGCGEGSPQMEWLRQDLATRSTACTLAYWQQPVFSSTVTPRDQEMLPIFQVLYEAGAEVVINGYDHFYERFAPQDPTGDRDTDDGIRQFIVGTGGRSLHPFGSPAPNSEVRFNQAYGVLALTLFPGGYEWEFVSEPGSGFTDLGTDVCH